MMPPMRGRELKHTESPADNLSDRMPPMRGRELKLLRDFHGIRLRTMPPMRGRELKLRIRFSRSKGNVDAPYAGA